MSLHSPYQENNGFIPQQRPQGQETSTSRRTSGNMALPTSSRQGPESYSTSLSPTSPVSFILPSSSSSSSNPTRQRSPSPSSLGGDFWRRMNGHLRTPSSSAAMSRQRSTTSRLSMSRRLSPYFSLRILTPILLWTIAIWSIHTFLIPLPVPKLPQTSSKANEKVAAADHHLSMKFPQPPLRTGDDFLDSVDPRWRPFDPLPPPELPFPRLRPTRFLPPRCLEQWFIDGETLCGKGEMGEEEKLDAVWLWVNGSDHRWRDSMVHWRSKEHVYSPEHHFREQNELAHSMRSVLDALPGHLRTFHLILADYPFDLPGDISLLPESIIPGLEASVASQGRRRPHARSWDEGERDLAGGHGEVDSSNNLTERVINSVSPALASQLASTWRVVQTPTWLNFARRDKSIPSHPFHPFSANQDLETRGRLHRAEINYPTLRYAAHSEIFHLPTMDRDGRTEELGEREWKEREWRKNALPSFNSMAIESRVGWLPGLSDVTLSLNDDFFLLRPHAVSDFHSPLYGSVIRFDHGYYQQVRPLLDKARFNDAGEVGGLYHANHLLSQRFPRRLRPYFAHVPKVITRGLHHEASLMFKEALAESSQRRFRELMMGEGDIQMQWLLTSLRVERWREALLWTYTVAHLGTVGQTTDSWSDEARVELKDLFGLEENDEDVVKIEVHKGERWTLESGRMGKVFEQAGWEAPKATEFLFSSMDGHMPPILKPGVDSATNDKCLLDLDRCFGSFWSRVEDVSSTDMFKRLTFQYPECGDCLITALVTASGPLGLSAFFPARQTTFENAPLPHGKAYPTYPPPPHLPLTPTWHEADFSLEAIMKTTALPGEVVNLREYCMKLLSRYQYLSAKSVSHFHMLKSPEHAHRVFKMIQDNKDVSILGLNDDIEEGYDEVKGIMGEWFQMRWPKKAVWEREWDPVKDRLDL